MNASSFDKMTDHFLATKPSIPQAQILFEHLREIEREVSVGKARVHGYVRDMLGLDEHEPDPEFLQEWQDGEQDE